MATSREIEQSRFRQQQARSERYKRQLINKVQAPLPPCAHERTVTFVVADTENHAEAVIDGEQVTHCANVLCNELLRVG